MVRGHDHRLVIHSTGSVEAHRKIGGGGYSMQSDQHAGSMNDSMMSTDGSHTELHQLQLQSLLLGISSDASSKGEGCVVTFLL